MIQILTAFVTLIAVVVGAWLNNFLRMSRDTKLMLETKKKLSAIARSELLNVSMQSGASARVIREKFLNGRAMREVDVLKCKLPEGSFFALKLDDIHLLPDNMRIMMFRFMIFLRNTELEIDAFAKTLQRDAEAMQQNNRLVLEEFLERFVMTEEISRRLAEELFRFHASPEKYTEPDDTWWAQLFKTSKDTAMEKWELGRRKQIVEPESVV